MSDIGRVKFEFTLEQLTAAMTTLLGVKKPLIECSEDMTGAVRALVGAKLDSGYADSFTSIEVVGEERGANSRLAITLCGSGPHFASAVRQLHQLLLS